MKIAKKVLALVMAVAMVACFTAMAFAADEKVVLEASEVENNIFTLSIVVKDGSMATSDWTLKYDSSALKVAVEDDEDLIYFGSGVGKAVNKGKIMGAFNAEKAGEILCAITMTETLAEDVGSSFDAAAGCELLCIDFELVNADPANVVVTLEEKDAAEGTPAIATVTLFPKEVVETPDAPVETPDAPVETPDAPVETPDAPVETPDAPVETPDAGTTGKDDLGMGDTGVLAVAAGVVALAGAAFVVSKKRK